MAAVSEDFNFDSMQEFMLEKGAKSDELIILMCN
jgi:hypothetical protein